MTFEHRFKGEGAFQAGKTASAKALRQLVACVPGVEGDNRSEMMGLMLPGVVNPEGSGSHCMVSSRRGTGSLWPLAGLELDINGQEGKQGEQWGGNV